MNHLLISGRLVKNPELKQGTKGTPYLSFDLATSKADSTTDTGFRTMYVNCVAFGKTAETISKYCDKGDSLFVEGELSIKDFTNDEGKKMYRTSVEVRKIEFGPKKQSTNESVKVEGNFKKISEPYPEEPEINNSHYVDIKTDDLPFY